jgi:hypothetical protein
MLEVLFGILFFAWIGLSLAWLGTFTQRGRTPWAKRGYRYRRVRWGSAIAATACFILAGTVGQGLSPSPELQAGKPVAAEAPAADAPAPDFAPSPSAPKDDSVAPVTEVEIDAGDRALCAVAAEKVNEVAAGEKVEEDATAAVLELMIAADGVLTRQRGISDWRAQKIITASFDRMRQQDPNGNLFAYCMNR